MILELAKANNWHAKVRVSINGVLIFTKINELNFLSLGIGTEYY